MPASIVVLPFADLSPGQDQEYFCHGLTEEIINTLTRVPGLRVISRTSAFAFQGRDLDVTEIGRRLRVGTALEGSVRKAGDRVRVTAQLVNADGRLSALVEAIRPGALRRLCDSGRDRRDDRARAAERARQRSGRNASAVRPRGPRRVPERDVRAEQMDRRLDAPGHRRLPRGDRSGSGLRSGVRRTRRGLRLALFRRRASSRPPTRCRRPDGRSRQALELEPASGRRAQGSRVNRHEPRLGSSGSRGRVSRAPSSSAPGSAAAHLWNAWRLALLERQHEQALLELEEAERLDPLDLQLKTLIGLRPLLPPRSRSRDRAVRESAGARAVVRLCSLRAGRRLHATGGVRPGIRGVRQGDRAGRPLGEPRRRARLRPWSGGQPRPGQRAAPRAHSTGGRQLRLRDVDRPDPPRALGSRPSVRVAGSRASTSGTAR